MVDFLPYFQLRVKGYNNYLLLKFIFESIVDLLALLSIILSSVLIYL